MKQLLMQPWLESERGWGVRPDGCSMHFNEADHRVFVDKYWDSMPDEVPDEYSRPNGNPYYVEVTDDLFNEVMISEYGKRFWRIPDGVLAKA
jgi:hypothetical protein